MTGSQPKFQTSAQLQSTTGTSCMAQDTTSTESMATWADCTIRWTWIDGTGDRIIAASIDSGRCVEKETMAEMNSYDLLDPLFLSFSGLLRICGEEAHAKDVTHILSEFQFISLHSCDNDRAEYRLLRAFSDMQEAYRDHMKNGSDKTKWRIFTVWPGTVTLHGFDSSEDDIPIGVVVVDRPVHASTDRQRPRTLDNEDEVDDEEDDKDDDEHEYAFNELQTKPKKHRSGLSSRVPPKRKRESSEQSSTIRPHNSCKKPCKSTSSNRSAIESKFLELQNAIKALSSNYS